MAALMVCYHIIMCYSLLWRHIVMSHCLLWRHIVLLTVGVYSSNHRVLYTIEISMTRIFKKSVGPYVRLSVRLSVRL